MRDRSPGEFLDRSQVDEAIDVFEQVLADRRQVLGDEHPDTLTTRENLSALRQSRGWVQPSPTNP
ncbi:tetratricopeptide repeat protein [Dactylosporangium darangshiense]|uniref:tetratricopeptide repeat protein n=1 Tax=Dactylosporangium darangshiense TaxID=579108 RepID=UPI0031E7B47D